VRLNFREVRLKRIELRQQILSITLVLLAAILSAAFAQKGLEEYFPTLNAPSVAFIYPPIATSLALGWVQQEYRINLLGKYIYDNIEKAIPALGWEKHVVADTSESTKLKWHYILLSHGSVFIWTEIIAIIVGISMLKNTVLESGLIIIDVLSFVIIIIILYNIYVDTQIKKGSMITK
jgi:hypothetical protein